MAGKDLQINVLYVVQGEQHPSLYSSSLVSTGVNWIHGKPPVDGAKLAAKFRYRQPDQGVTIHMRGGDTCEVVFDKPQKAVTPGQSVVFYDGEECLGGGTIDRVIMVQPDLPW